MAFGQLSLQQVMARLRQRNAANVSALEQMGMEAPAQRQAGGGQMAYAPAPAAPNPVEAVAGPAHVEAAKAWEPSFLYRLGGILNGESKQDLIDQHNAREAQITRQRDMADVMQQVRAKITDPRELFTFLQNPEEYTKQYATNVAAANVNAGDSRVYGDRSVYTAPKVEMSGDSGVVLTPDKMTVLGSRPISQAEKLAEGRLAEDKRYHDMSIDARLEQIRKPPAPRGGGGRPILPAGYRPK